MQKNSTQSRVEKKNVQYFKSLEKIASTVSPDKYEDFKNQFFKIIKWFVSSKQISELKKFLSSNNFPEEFIDTINRLLFVYCYRPIIHILRSPSNYKGSENKKSTKSAIEEIRKNSYFCIPIAIPVVLTLDEKTAKAFDFNLKREAQKIMEAQLLRRGLNLPRDITLILDGFMYPHRNNAWITGEHVRSYLINITTNALQEEKFYAPLIYPPFEVTETVYTHLNLPVFKNEKFGNRKTISLLTTVRIISLIALVNVNDEDLIDEVEKVFDYENRKVNFEALSEVKNSFVSLIKNQYPEAHVDVSILPPIEFDMVPEVGFELSRDIDIMHNLNMIKAILKENPFINRPYLRVNINNESQSLSTVEVEVCNAPSGDVLYFFTFQINTVEEPDYTLNHIIRNISAYLKIPVLDNSSLEDTVDKRFPSDKQIPYC